MTKTVKICDMCGKECEWLYTLPILHIKGYKIDFAEDTPMGTAKNELCEECTKKVFDEYNKKIT